ncbi:hypothetical protein HMPREF0208_04154 [Citrobacter koseri]|nr:hypothetical protein HMPREF0208_04154 [Citrobacter koseri]
MAFITSPVWEQVYRLYNSMVNRQQNGKNSLTTTGLIFGE